MSVLVKGMDMPISCAKCPLSISECSAVMERVKTSEPKIIEWIPWSYRHEDCPLVEVPTPHGRLIDADALETDLKRQCKEVFRTDAVSPDDYWITRNQAYNENLWKTWCESFYDYLKTRPIIIPTEESE